MRTNKFLLLILVSISACAAPAPKVNTIESDMTVTPPDCPDWSDGIMYGNYNNVRSGNFGCATVTNHGQMIANPVDMVAGQGSSSYDSGHTSTSVTKYKAGPSGPAGGGK